MKQVHKHLLASVLTLAFLSPAMAEEHQHVVCDENAKIEVDNMGMVNEAALQKHIDKMQVQLTKVRHARGSHVSKKRELKQHIADMQEAMKELHKEMYIGGCKESMHGAPLETRVNMMQKRIDAMQKMVDQLVEHLAEQQPEK